VGPCGGRAGPVGWLQAGYGGQGGRGGLLGLPGGRPGPGRRPAQVGRRARAGAGAGQAMARARGEASGSTAPLVGRPVPPRLHA